MTTTQTSDSVRIIERWRDTTIYEQPDKAWLKGWLECDSVGQVLLRELEIERGRNITPHIKIVNDTIYVECKTDSLERLLKIRDLEIKMLKEMQTEVVVEVEKELSWWETTQMKMGQLFMIAIAVLIIITVIKQRLK
ncbi:MAG: hypothetical protein IKC86_07355 [Prevotella sp.]|nr:hypothetical protein [Prevotella sp.]